MIEDNKKTIEVLFFEGKYDNIKMNDIIIFKNSTRTYQAKIKGVMMFDDIYECLNAVNTKNLIGKTLIKSTEWFEKNYPNNMKSKVILVNFKPV